MDEGYQRMWGQLIGAAIGAAGNVAGSGSGGANSADSIFGPSMFNNDSSGWAVNFGGDGSNLDLNNSNRGGPSLDNAAAMPGSRLNAGLGSQLLNSPVFLLVGVVVVVLLLRKK
jgi:hypothetical protein